MTRPRAPTQEVGTFSNTATIPWVYTARGVTYQSQQSPIVVKWCKSPTERGSSLPGGFRAPTSYMRAVARLDIVPGEYEGDVYSGCLSGSPGWKYTGGDGRAHLSMATPGINWASMKVTVDPNIVNRAVTEALLKVQNQKVHLGAALAEAKTTLDMIVNRIKTLIDMYKAIRKGRWAEVWRHLYHHREVIGRRASRERVYRMSVNGRTYIGTYREWYTTVRTSWRRDSSSAYLEVVYGWLPLMSDIYGGIDALRNGFRERDKIFSVKREVRDPILLSEFVGAPQNRIYAMDGKAFAACKVQLWGCVVGDLHAGSALGVVNPLSVLWEATPFSFVIDWLMPVGAWLEHLTATLGVDFVAGCRTDTIQATVGLARRNIFCTLPLNKDVWKGGVGPRGTVNVFAMQRHKYGGWPWAFLYLKNPFSMVHAMNAVALIRQTTKR